MVSFTSLATVALACLASALPSAARISGFTAPTQVLHPGQNFDVTFATQSFIQNNLQYYAIFGYTLGAGYSGSLGTLLGNGVDLVTSGHSSTGRGAYNVSLQIPESLTTTGVEEYTLGTSILGTVGASGLVTLQFFNATISISSD